MFIHKPSEQRALQNNCSNGREDISPLLVLNTWFAKAYFAVFRKPAGVNLPSLQLAPIKDRLPRATPGYWYSGNVRSLEDT